jgi:hypothetical protein
MAKKTYEELVQLKQDKKIGWLDFVRQCDNADEYAKWCEDHGTEQSEESAELFVDMTEERLFEENDDLL